MIESENARVKIDFQKKKNRFRNSAPNGFACTTSTHSVPAKRTRNFDTKRPPIPLKPKKSQSKPIQESAMNPPPSKQKKSKDSQFTRHVTTSIKNLSNDFDRLTKQVMTITQTRTLSF